MGAWLLEIKKVPVSAVIIKNIFCANQRPIKQFAKTAHTKKKKEEEERKKERNLGTIAKAI